MMHEESERTTQYNLWSACNFYESLSFCVFYILVQRDMLIMELSPMETKRGTQIMMSLTYIYSIPQKDPI